jgi:hypothetical protein
MIVIIKKWSFLSIQVGLYNAAFGKEAKLSSDLLKFKSIDSRGYKCVDGNLNTNYETGFGCCNTLIETTPTWFTVDLGEIHQITSITLLNRGDLESE